MSYEIDELKRSKADRSEVWELGRRIDDLKHENHELKGNISRVNGQLQNTIHVLNQLIQFLAEQNPQNEMSQQLYDIKSNLY